ncbi:tyrosine-type recombinase/integrase [Acidipropionibacterium timonense]|uniref:tyrosine-type recombinase/integrase n=1 Tax=Acidipropionibacterium timonense TaxID=2161818 RepID=UPI001AEC06CD
MRLADDRTRLVLRLGRQVGLRRAEICQVNRNDLIDTGEGPSLIVNGKGGVERIVPLPDDLAATLRRRFEQQDSPWLFPGGQDGHLCPERVAELARAVLPDGWSLHACRHGFATSVYAQRHDLLVVQQLLGHRSVATTQRYTAVPSSDLRAAVNAAA